MEVVSPGVNGHGPPLDSPAALDPNSIVQHLADLLEVTLGASTEDLERAGSLFSESGKQETIHQCNRFASESQVALYVQKVFLVAEQSNGHDGSSGQYHNEIYRSQG